MTPRAGRCATAARPVERALDAVESSYELDARVLTVAPNLFGRLGSTSLFTFYESDEYRGELSADLLGPAPWTTEISFEQEVDLLWTDSRSLSLLLLGTWSSGQAAGTGPVDAERRLGFTITWSHARIPVSVGWLPLPAFLDEEEQRIDHETALEIDYEATDALTLLARLTHSSTVRFGEAGSLRLHGGLGAGGQGDAGLTDLLLGVRVGIEGEIRL